MNNEVVEKNEILRLKKKSFVDLESIYTEKRDSHAAKEAERKTFSSQVSSMEDQIQDIENQIERLETRHETNTQELIGRDGRKY